MAKSEYAYTYLTFNNRPMPKNSTGMTDKIIESAEKILNKHNIEFTKCELDVRFQKRFDRLWNATDSHYVRYWLDRAIDDMSIKIFCFAEKKFGDHKKGEAASIRVQEEFMKVWK